MGSRGSDVNCGASSSLVLYIIVYYVQGTVLLVVENNSVYSQYCN